MQLLLLLILVAPALNPPCAAWNSDDGGSVSVGIQFPLSVFGGFEEHPFCSAACIFLSAAVTYMCMSWRIRKDEAAELIHSRTRAKLMNAQEKIVSLENRVAALEAENQQLQRQKKWREDILKENGITDLRKGVHKKQMEAIRQSGTTGAQPATLLAPPAPWIINNNNNGGSSTDERSYLRRRR